MNPPLVFRKIPRLSVLCRAEKRIHLQLVEWIGGRRKLESGPPCSLRTFITCFKGESEREGQRLFFLQPIEYRYSPSPSLPYPFFFSFMFFKKKTLRCRICVLFFPCVVALPHMPTYFFPSPRSVSRLAHYSHKETSRPVIVPYPYHIVS